MCIDILQKFIQISEAREISIKFLKVKDIHRDAFFVFSPK